MRRSLGVTTSGGITFKYSRMAKLCKRTFLLLLGCHASNTPHSLLYSTSKKGEPSVPRRRRRRSPSRIACLLGWFVGRRESRVRQNFIKGWEGERALWEKKKKKKVLSDLNFFRRKLFETLMQVVREDLSFHSFSSHSPFCPWWILMLPLIKDVKESKDPFPLLSCLCKKLKFCSCSPFSLSLVPSSLLPLLHLSFAEDVFSNICSSLSLSFSYSWRNGEGDKFYYAEGRLREIVQNDW